MRLQAAEWFAEGVTPPEVARRLRVSCNSAYAWRRRWRAGGKAALASKGPGGAVCRLSGTQLISGVLIGADKADESLGQAPTPDADRAGVMHESLSSSGRDFFTVDEGPGGRSSGS